jgi:hypothetical protein
MKQHALESLEMSTKMASTLCPKGIQHFAQQGCPNKCTHNLERTQAKGSTFVAKQPPLVQPQPTKQVNWFIKPKAKQHQVQVQKYF